MDESVITHLLYEIKEEMNKRALHAREVEERVRDLEREVDKMNSSSDAIRVLAETINGVEDRAGLKGRVSRLDDRMGMIWKGIGLLVAQALATISWLAFGGS